MVDMMHLLTMLLESFIPKLWLLVGGNYLDCASQQAFKIGASFWLMHKSKHSQKFQLRCEPMSSENTIIGEWHSQWHEMGWTFINLSVHTDHWRSMSIYLFG